MLTQLRARRPHLSLAWAGQASNPPLPAGAVNDLEARRHLRRAAAATPALAGRLPVDRRGTRSLQPHQWQQQRDLELLQRGS